MRACAAAACASGNTESITGFTLPASISGQTFSRRLAAIAPFSATERGRSAESVIQQYLRFVRPAQTRFIDPARHYCDIVVACEAAPPNRNAQPDEDSVDRLVAPVWVQLQKLGVAA